MSKDQFADIPSHEAEQTSSIGGLWPPESSSHHRIKGIYPEIITTQDSLRHLYRKFINLGYRLTENSYPESPLSPPTRIQIRAIVEADLLRQFSSDALFSQLVEAVIPLDPGKFGHEPVLFYLGKNSQIRQPSDKDLFQVQQNIMYAKQEFPKTVSQMLSRAMINGYQLSIVTNWTESEINQLSALYIRFGWNIKDVYHMVQNSRNIFCVAKYHDQIISAGIAETAAIPFNQNTLTVAEITEAATLSEFGGQGLYTAVSATLLRHLAQQPAPVDLVFGECNGLSLPVLKTAKTQGRTFAAEVGTDFGFPHSGILRQQVPIEGVLRHSTYNDLVPAFLTSSQLVKYNDLL